MAQTATRRTLVGVLGLVLLMLGRPIFAQRLSRSALGTTSPDMSGVADVLHGKTILLPQDDAGLLVTSWNQGQFQFVPFNSSNSSFTQEPTINTNLVSNFSYGPTSVPSSSATGRMFNTGNDSVITIGETFTLTITPQWSYSYWNPSTGTVGSYPLNSTFSPNSYSIYTKVVMGDFQGNDLQSALLFAESDFGSHVSWQMNIVAPINTNQIDDINTQGGGPELFGDVPPSQAPVGTTIVSGDFNRDGVDDVAVLLRDGQTVMLYTVNPSTLQISPWQTIKLPAPLTSGTLAAGRFNSSPDVVLAAIGQQQSTQQIIVDYIDPVTNLQNPSVTIVQTSFSVPNLNSSVFEGVFAQSSPLYNQGLNSLEQLVLGLAYEYDSWHAILVGTFDQSFNFNLQEATGYQGCLLGMEVGNFNNLNSSGTIDPSLQISLFKTFWGNSQCVPPFNNGPLYVELRGVDVPPSVSANPQAPPANGPTDWLDNQQRTELIPSLGDYNNLRLTPSFLIGDLQGRSERLGTPEHVTLTGHIQPNFVLGMPPMHVDWLFPYAGTREFCEANESVPGQPECLLNLDVLPYGSASDKLDAFSSAFSLNTTSGISTSRKSTSSWGIAAKVTQGVTAKYEIPLESSGSVSYKQTVGNAYQSVASQYQSEYSTKSEDVTDQTAFDDEVYFTAETQNFYNYPILGKFDENGNQIYATFSVPSAVQIGKGGGSTFDWYQPIHEPGNVLSYPPTSTALANEYQPGSISAQATSGCVIVGSTNLTQTVTWNNQNQRSVSSGWTDALSENMNVSVSGSVGGSIASFGASVKFSTDIDVSGSQAWGALNQSVNTDNSSQAVFLTVPAITTGINQFAYGFENYVFGTSNAIDPFQNAASLLPNTLNISTSGPLFVGFTANPEDQCGQGGASFWTDAYQHQPDVGFNHPNRWDVNTSNLVSFNSPVTPSGSNPLITQSFYRMKGLFITTGGPADVSSAIGAGTVMSVPAGQSIWLTARVYNFSLSATDQLNPGSTVHVRFYAQKRCLVQYPDEPVLDLCPNGAFQISGNQRDGDVIISAIPGFNDPSGQPNWSAASVNFDTTGYDDTELVFWTVTWIEDANGQVIGETPDHGVTLQSFAGKTFSNITDIPVENHSNNVGFYMAQHPFYVAPAIASSDASTVSKSKEQEEQEGPLRYIDLSLRSKSFRVDRVTHFDARFQAAKSFPGSTVLYFDGDPARGGRLFDMQTVHALQPGASTQHVVNFRAERCGPHTLYAISEPEGLPARTGTIKANVTINPAREVENMMTQVRHISIHANLKRSLLERLSVAKHDFRDGNLQSGLESLRTFANIVRPISQNRHRENFLFESRILLGEVALVQSCEAQLHAQP